MASDLVERESSVDFPPLDEFVVMKGYNCGVCGSDKYEATNRANAVSSIQCDECSLWFHLGCLTLEEFEVFYINQFICSTCTGPGRSSTYFNTVAPHRYNFTSTEEVDLPAQIGSRAWLEEFKEKLDAVPEPGVDYVISCQNGKEFMKRFDVNAEWTKLYKIQDKSGLGMKIPRKGEFSTKDLLKYFGDSYIVDCIDVFRQTTIPMSIGRFHEMFSSGDRSKLFNILSLEFSQNYRMTSLAKPPSIVQQLSFVDKLWPESTKAGDAEDSSNDLIPKESQPRVSRYCLASMAGSYTDFHIDFGGSSVWYHIYKGEKVFLIAPPTTENLEKFKNHQISSETNTTVDLADLLPKGTVKRVVLREGETMMIPAGWIHAVYTPKDSIVFGGNFLHLLNVPTQLKIFEIEQETRDALQIDDKFFFPNFERLNLQAARDILVVQLKEANRRGKAVSLSLIKAAVALIPAFNRWYFSNKDRKIYKLHLKVFMELTEEVNKQSEIQDLREFGDYDGDISDYEWSTTSKYSVELPMLKSSIMDNFNAGYFTMEERLNPTVYHSNVNQGHSESSYANEEKENAAETFMKSIKTDNSNQKRSIIYARLPLLKKSTIMDYVPFELHQNIK